MQYLPPQSFSAAPASIPRAVPATPGRPAADTSVRARDQVRVSPSAMAEAFTHDARNLLTALGLYADLLNAPGVLSEPYQHYASELRLLADRSTSLLRHVFVPEQTDDTAEAAAECKALDPDTPLDSSREPLCEPFTVLRRFLPLLQAQARGVAEVVLLPPRRVPALPISGEALERITANLVCNAVEAMRPGAASAQLWGTVWIGVDARDGVARLRVEDSGPGMDAETARSFLYPESDGADIRANGRGWGRHIVHGLAEETGGQVNVRRRSLGGTVITVQWPLPSSSAVQVFAEGCRGGKAVGPC